MANYKKMYYSLFNSITDALNEMGHNNYRLAEQTLKRAQSESEELFIQTETNIKIGGEENIIFVKKK